MLDFILARVVIIFAVTAVVILAQWGIPRRFTVRYLLIATAVIAVSLAAYLAWAPY